MRDTHASNEMVPVIGLEQIILPIKAGFERVLESTANGVNRSNGSTAPDAWLGCNVKGMRHDLHSSACTDRRRSSYTYSN